MRSLCHNGSGSAGILRATEFRPYLTISGEARHEKKAINTRNFQPHVQKGHRTVNQNDIKASKKAYVSPKLRVYGDVRTITQTVGAGGVDDGLGPTKTG